jgi:HAD superfamily hydrolase (TIGR01509 family)
MEGRGKYSCGPPLSRIMGKRKCIKEGGLLVDGVIFDMDGLMFDTEPLWTDTWPIILPEFGFDEVPAAMPDTMRGSSGESAFRIMRSFLGEDAPVEDIWARLKEEAHKALALGITKKPGLDELLEFLRGAGIPMAVASSSSPSIIEMNLANGGVTDYFALTISGEDVDRPKPDPQVFLVSAERMGTDPAKTLVLEDSLNGVRAGAAGGFITVMVPDMVAPTEEIKALYTRECKDLIEVRDLLATGELG